MSSFSSACSCGWVCTVVWKSFLLAAEHGVDCLPQPEQRDQPGLRGLMASSRRQRCFFGSCSQNLYRDFGVSTTTPAHIGAKQRPLVAQIIFFKNKPSTIPFNFASTPERMQSIQQYHFLRSLNKYPSKIFGDDLEIALPKN